MPDDPVADDIDTLMAWGCWAVPLLFAEPLIQLAPCGGCPVRRPSRQRLEVGRPSQAAKSVTVRCATRRHCDRSAAAGSGRTGRRSRA